jgi:uncharacterized protein
MGGFYRPRDQRINLNALFFHDLENKFGGCSNSDACRLSEAFVIAHQVGHHVQDELGILARVAQEQQTSSSKAQQNRLQVRVELQADCLAGVWANRAQRKRLFFDSGEVDQALRIAFAIGDDLYAITHGTPEHRKRWLMTGLNGGQVSACDTMSASSLKGCSLGDTRF